MALARGRLVGAGEWMASQDRTPETTGITEDAPSIVRAGG